MSVSEYLDASFHQADCSGLSFNYQITLLPSKMKEPFKQQETGELRGKERSSSSTNHNLALK